MELDGAKALLKPGRVRRIEQLVNGGTTDCEEIMHDEELNLPHSVAAEVAVQLVVNSLTGT